MPNQKMNYCDRKRFNALIGLLNVGVEGSKYEVKFSIQNIYLDAGADMKWETIHCRRWKRIEGATAYGDEIGGYQILSPFQWDVLQYAGVEELYLLAEQILKEQASLLGLEVCRGHAKPAPQE